MTCCNKCCSFHVKFRGEALNRIYSVIPPASGIVLECAHLGYSRGKMMKLEKPKDARKWVEWSFFHRFLSPVLFILLPAPLLHIPMAISSLFEVVLGFACCSSHHRWLIVLPLNLSMVFSRSLSLFPSLENAGRVPRQKELSSPCQQPRVWDRPVSWQQ